MSKPKFYKAYRIDKAAWEKSKEIKPVSVENFAPLLDFNEKKLKRVGNGTLRKAANAEYDGIVNAEIYALHGTLYVTCRQH